MVLILFQWLLLLPLYRTAFGNEKEELNLQLKGRGEEGRTHWTYTQNKGGSSLKINLTHNSTRVFNYVGSFIILLSQFSRRIYNLYLLSILFFLILLLFLFYLRVRLNHYRQCFQVKKSLIYFLIENSILLMGIIYVLLIDNLVFKGSNEVNFLFVFPLIIFLFPSFIVNQRLSDKGKQK